MNILLLDQGTSKRESVSGAAFHLVVCIDSSYTATGRYLLLHRTSLHHNYKRMTHLGSSAFLLFRTIFTARSCVCSPHRQGKVVPALLIIPMTGSGEAGPSIRTPVFHGG